MTEVIFLPGDLTVFCFLFYFGDMQTRATASASTAGNTAIHRPRFTSARDARNRKSRGLWKRGNRYCVQARIPGEKSTLMRSSRDRDYCACQRNHGRMNHASRCLPACIGLELFKPSRNPLHDGANRDKTAREKAAGQQISLIA